MRNQKKAAKKAVSTRVGDAGAVLPVMPLSPSQRLRALTASDPYADAMSSGSSWGDLEEPMTFGYTPTLEELMARKELDLRVQEESIWSQSWSERLATYYADTYDLRDLSEDEYEACMTWMYAQGWNIHEEDREGVKAYPDNLPPRVWIAPPSRFDWLLRQQPSLSGTPEQRMVAETCCDHTVVKEKKKGKGPVPRFCRSVDQCADAACRYVHGDTMPRLNEPCNFGAACGANDPAKRALCIRMHPGETWTTDLVIHRPVATVAC
jgi:hypothetical protein